MLHAVSSAAGGEGGSARRSSCTAMTDMLSVLHPNLTAFGATLAPPRADGSPMQPSHTKEQHNDIFRPWPTPSEMIEQTCSPGL
mmetsp:Transcript_45756/g.97726  ORF Transcript_45756/g.97726 Transcript_45756/m.97726 type:complete len:84 (-) Transcript_45756:1058-1309(-)